MGNNCVPLVADLFVFRYDSDFMLSLSDKLMLLKLLTLPQDI